VIYVLQVELTEKEIQKIRRMITRQNNVFAKKEYLDPLTLPSNIIGRRDQAEQLVRHIHGLGEGLLVPLISVYGRSGSGKSTVVKFVCQNMNDLACSAYVNLRKARTVFGCANMILGELGSISLTSAEGLNKAIDHIGFQIKRVLDENKKKFFVLILDEYDVIFYDKRGNPSDFMYKLLTLEENLREKGLWLCIITISNNALIDYNLDDRVKSRMGTTEIYFESYKQDDIVSILSDRAKKAFVKMPGKKILEHCALLCSASHGDARRALELLRITGETSNGKEITKEDVDRANEIVQKDRVSTIVSGASYHQRIVVLAICKNLLDDGKNFTNTSSIYQTYKKILPDSEKPLSYRRIVDLLIELQNAGLLSSNTISKGRGGYGTEYRLYMPPEMVAPLIDDKWWEGQVELKKKEDKLAELEKDIEKMGSRGGRRRYSLPYALLNKYGKFLNNH